jgi:hypothetical protein
LPTPLIVALDLADHVVVGKLVGIEELVDPDGGSGNGVRWGRATVEVRETLKGEKVEKVAFKVATWVTPDYGGSSPPRVYKVGNEGIWVTLQYRDEQVVNPSWGLLRPSQLDEVRKHLKELQDRQWSDEVGGLRVWAGVTNPDYSPRPVVVFCVKNFANKDVHCLTEGNTGLLSASVEDETGKARDCDLYWGRTADKDRPPAAYVLKPGEIMYLHPYYSWLDVGRDLAPGKYRVTVSMANRTAAGRLYPLRDSEKEVPLWTGQVSAKPVTLTVPEKQAR